MSAKFKVPVGTDNETVTLSGDEGSRVVGFMRNGGVRFANKRALHAFRCFGKEPTSLDLIQQCQQVQAVAG